MNNYFTTRKAELEKERIFDIKKDREFWDWVLVGLLFDALFVGLWLVIK